MASVVLKSATAKEQDLFLLAREDVLNRYRRLRGHSRRIHQGAMELVSGPALLGQARRLGLAQKDTFVLEDMDELFFALDLAIYTSPPARRPAIDRYLASVDAEVGSEAAQVMRAMRSARFAVVRFERRHPTAGFVVRDLARESDHWLIDEGLELSADDGFVIATRLIIFEDFCMTAGVMVPLDADLLDEALTEVVFLYRKTPRELVADRRFAEALYRVALADGILERMAYRVVEPEAA